MRLVIEMTVNGAPRNLRSLDGEEANNGNIGHPRPYQMLIEDPMTHETIAETSPGTTKGTVIVTADISRVSREINGCKTH